MEMQRGNINTVDDMQEAIPKKAGKSKRFGKNEGTELQENILRPWSEKNCIEIDIDDDSKVCQG